MRKSILLIAILFCSVFAKSQNWDPSFVKVLKEYFFIPVEFENFGEWIAGIENDSSLVFKKKVFTQVNDSINLNFDLQKAGISSSIKNAILSNRISGKTILDKRVKFESNDKSLLTAIDLPPRKITTLYLYATISFDSTTTGRLLANEIHKELEDQFGVFFANTRVEKSNKNIKKRKFHPQEERAAYFKRKNELISMFRIRTNNFKDSNKVELCLSYQLNH